MEKVTDITKNVPHTNYHVLCVNTWFNGKDSLPCLNKWVATVPDGTNLFRLECPKCGESESFPSHIMISKKVDTWEHP